jgi:hypothetical protein
MSNKSPIESTPCGVCRGWAWCKIKAVTCWLQNKLEFLCERSKPELTDEDRADMALDFAMFHAKFSGKVISERCLEASYETREEFSDWLKCAEDHGYEATKTTKDILRGRLTLINKIGMLPTTGLSCMCCAGYRVWFALIIGMLLGFSL